MFHRLAVVEEIGLYGYHLQDLATQVRWHWLRPPLDDDGWSRVDAWFRARAPQRAGQGPSFGAARGMNLIIVQAESMQAFVLGLESFTVPAPEMSGLLLPLASVFTVASILSAPFVESMLRKIDHAVDRDAAIARFTGSVIVACVVLGSLSSTPSLTTSVTSKVPAVA